MWLSIPGINNTHVMPSSRHGEQCGCGYKLFVGKSFFVRDCSVCITMPNFHILKPLHLQCTVDRSEVNGSNTESEVNSFNIISLSHSPRMATALSQCMRQQEDLLPLAPFQLSSILHSMSFGPKLNGRERKKRGEEIGKMRRKREERKARREEIEKGQEQKTIQPCQLQGRAGNQPRCACPPS